MSEGWDQLRNEEEGEFSREADGEIGRTPSGRRFFREPVGCGKLEQPRMMRTLREEAAGGPLWVLGDEVPTPGRGESLLVVGYHRLRTVGAFLDEEVAAVLVEAVGDTHDAGCIRSEEMGEPAGVPDAGSNPR